MTAASLCRQQMSQTHVGLQGVPWRSVTTRRMAGLVHELMRTPPRGQHAPFDWQHLAPSRCVQLRAPGDVTAHGSHPCGPLAPLTLGRQGALDPAPHLTAADKGENKLNLEVPPVGRNGSADWPASPPLPFTAGVGVPTSASKGPLWGGVRWTRSPRDSTRCQWPGNCPVEPSRRSLTVSFETEPVCAGGQTSHEAWP